MLPSLLSSHHHTVWVPLANPTPTSPPTHPQSMTPEEAAAAAAAAAAEAAASAAGAGADAAPPPGMEEAAEAVVKSGLSFAVVIIVLLVCAGIAAFLVYLQRKRHETYSLLSGIDNRYDEIYDKLQVRK